ncbi:MAG: DUF4194 domain-containing protein [Anaerocolumna sp.]
MFEIFQESVAQRDKFRIAANKLLNNCFLIKKREDTRKEYMFVVQNKELFIPYFDLLGYRLQINEDQGVIGIVNYYGTGRLQFTKYDSIMLLILRLLYIEKRKELGTYSEEVTVLMEEIRDKYAMLKIKAKPVMDKSMERNIISTMKRYNLVTNIETDVTQADARIIIYPSVVLAMQIEDMNTYYSQMQDRLTNYGRGEDNGDTEETSDTDPAD